MVSKRKRYSREFKIETVRLVTGSDHSVSEVARDLEIHPNTLYKWIHQYGEADYERMTNLSKALRLRLAAVAEVTLDLVLLEQRLDALGEHDNDLVLSAELIGRYGAGTAAEPLIRLE